MILGILIGIAVSIGLYWLTNPCLHDETAYVMKCKKCHRIVGDIDRWKNEA